MSGFSPHWLALREPFDAAAREAARADLGWPAFLARLRASAGPGQPLQVLDLGCGTGANLRATALHLGGTQHWRLVDHDRRVLDAAIEALTRWALAHGLQAAVADGRLSVDGPGLRLQAQFVQADLARTWDGAWFDGVHLVTASALLDLVSAAWLERLAGQCRQAGAAVSWALSVDHRLHWAPVDEDDGALARAFAEHQGRDKGFGPALGGAAPAQAAALFGRAGYRCTAARSDWCIDGGQGARDQAMLQALIDGMVAAAAEQVPEQAWRFQAWCARRRAQLAHLRLELGHLDLVGWPQSA